MADKLPKNVAVELDDDLRIVLAHVCEDLHLEPGIAINRLCIAAIYCAICKSDQLNPCKEMLDGICQAFMESLDELYEAYEQRRKYHQMIEWLKRFEV